MKFDWSTWNIGGRIIFVAGCVAIISMFLKWVDIGFASQSELNQITVFLLGLYIYPVLMLFKNQPINKGWGLVCGIAAVVLTILYINDKSIDFLGTTISVVGEGAWVFLFASIALIVGVFTYESDTQ